MITTLQPREDSSVAMAAPIPEHEPLIIATFPESVGGACGIVIEVGRGLLLEVMVDDKVL